MEQKFSQIEFVYRNLDGQEDPKGEGKKLCEQRSKNDSTLLIFQTTFWYFVSKIAFLPRETFFLKVSQFQNVLIKNQFHPKYQ